MTKESKTYSLLVYWGESVDLYLIPDDVADKRRKVLKRCQSKFINSDDQTKYMDILCALLAEKKDHVPDKNMKKYACKWKKYKVDVKKPISGKEITSVYLSGWAP